MVTALPESEEPVVPVVPDEDEPEDLLDEHAERARDAARPVAAMMARRFTWGSTFVERVRVEDFRSYRCGNGPHANHEWPSGIDQRALRYRPVIEPSSGNPAKSGHKGANSGLEK
jgi:hypothetical protein